MPLLPSTQPICRRRRHPLAHSRVDRLSSIDFSCFGRAVGANLETRDSSPMVRFVSVYMRRSVGEKS
jgi:hypothetical protein